MEFVIEAVDGDAGWPLVESLDRECYPPDARAQISWRDVVPAHADRRLLVRNGSDLVCHVGIHYRHGGSGST